MRRIQILMDDALDDRVAAEARSRGTSKGALIRQAVELAVGATPQLDEGWRALTGLIGNSAGGAVDDIDEFLYGPVIQPAS